MMQWIQYQLDNHATVDDVLHDCDRIALDGWSWHFFAADNSGKTAAIEFIDGKAVVHAGQHMPVPVLCNSLYADELRWLRAFNGFGGVYPVRMDDRRIPRFIHAAEMIRTYDNRNPVDYGFDILKQLGGKNTRWSVVFDSRRMSMYFKTSVNSQVRSFALKSQDFEPSQPVPMLDVHCPGSGNVRDQFVSYDEGINNHTIQGLLDLYFADGERKKALDSTGINTEQLARRISEKLKPAQEEINFDLAGTWTGKQLFYPYKGSPVEIGWTMDLAWNNGQLTGTVKDNMGAINNLAIQNVRYDSGLLVFTLKDENSKFILDFTLGVSNRQIKGIFYAYLQGKGLVHLTR